MAVRKQIVVPDEIDRRIRRLAAQRGTSQSAVVADAIRALPDDDGQFERMMGFAGAIKNAPRRLSEEVDSTLYG